MEIIPVSEVEVKTIIISLKPKKIQQDMMEYPIKSQNTVFTL